MPDEGDAAAVVSGRPPDAGTVVDPFLARFDGPGLSGSARERGPTPVQGDPEQPGAERPVAVEIWEATDRPHEGLLHDVLGVVAIPEHPDAEAEDHPLVALDQLTRCLGIAATKGLDQRAVVHRGHLSPNRGLPGRPI